VGGNERGRGRGRVVEMNDTRAEEADERTLDKNAAAIEIVLLRAQLKKNIPAALLSASEYAWMRGCRRLCTHNEEDMRQVLCSYVCLCF
jgi:hypothetical protein